MASKLPPKTYLLGTLGLQMGPKCPTIWHWKIQRTNESKQYAQSPKMTSKSVDPPNVSGIEVFRTSHGGRFTSPLPPSAGPPRRPSGQSLERQPSKCEAQPSFQPGLAKNPDLSAVPPEGHLVYFGRICVWATDLGGWASERSSWAADFEG